MKITPEEIDLFGKYIFQISGIHISQEKGYLLETRFKPLLASLACRTFKELYDRIVGDSSGQLQKEVIDAISTNETYFFRDNTPFELMRNKIVPELIDRRHSPHANKTIPLRIWSAACSTGQEVYSVIITLLEMLPNPKRYEIFVLGTDISDQAVSQASYGKYNQFEVKRGMPGNILQKYFIQLGSDYKINDYVRSMAKFQKINLMQPFPNIGTFDLVFCRNVAIYFNHADKVKLFQKISRVLKTDGTLIVGGSENLAGVANDFVSKQYLGGIFYQLKGFADKQAAAPKRQKIKAATTSYREKKTPWHRPVGKTVYDKSPNLKKEQSPEADPSSDDQINAANIPVGAASGQQPPPPSSAAGIIGRGTVGPKNPLLASLQKTRQNSSPLLSSKGTTKSGGSSLLDKISQRDKKKK